MLYITHTEQNYRLSLKALNFRFSSFFPHLFITLNINSSMIVFKTQCIFLVFALVCAGYSQAKSSSASRELFKHLTGSSSQRHIRPTADLLNVPTVVNMSLNLISVKPASSHPPAIEARGWMMFQWDDARLAWNPEDYGNITQLQVPLKDIWRPDITVYNSETNASPFSEEQTLTLVYSTGAVSWVPKCSLVVAYNTTTKQAGNGDQSVQQFEASLKFGSWVYNGNEVDLQTAGRDSVDTSDLSPYSPYTITSSSVERNEVVYDCCVESYPSLVVSLVVESKKT